MNSEISILLGCIEKAEKNGYAIPFFSKKLIIKKIVDGKLPIIASYGLLISYEFAKAFWGEKILDKDMIISKNPSWKYHLQEMVLWKNPLNYLEKFLEPEKKEEFPDYGWAD